jgi:1-deoxy-D-xylulose-5-phosphate synthase
MQRGYDQVVHDVCLQKLPVIFCLDRAGLAGADGPTHHGNLDIAIMRCVPNMIVAAPRNEQELRNIMYTASLDSFKERGEAISIRYPRGQGVMPAWRTNFEEIQLGKGVQLRKGKDIAILSIGHIGNEAIKATEELATQGIDAAHYDMRFAKPLDEELLHEIFQNYQTVLTVEDASIVGGFGSAVAEFMVDNQYQSKIIRLGIPDQIVEHGEQNELYALCGIDSKGIAQKIAEHLGLKASVKASKALTE